MAIDVLPRRFWDKVQIGPGCWLWVGARVTDDYGVLKLGGKPTLTHRIMFEHLHGPIPHGMVVMHVCDNPPCCRPSHLRIGTVRDNARDMVSKGRGNNARGEANGASKYTEADVRKVCEMHAGGMSFNQIAKETGISRWTVSNMVRRKYWTHIQLEVAA